MLISPNEGALLRHILNRNRQNDGWVFKLYLQLESPQEVACLRYILNRHGQERGVFKLDEEVASPTKEAEKSQVLSPEKGYDGYELLCQRSDKADKSQSFQTYLPRCVAISCVTEVTSEAKEKSQVSTDSGKAGEVTNAYRQKSHGSHLPPLQEP